MNIGIFTDAYKPQISGVVTSIVTLKEGLEALGHTVYIITPSAPRQMFEDDHNVIRLRGLTVPFKDLKDYKVVPLVKRYLPMIKGLNLDVIHIHTEFTVGLLGMSAGKHLKVPMVYTLHTSYQDYTHYISKFMSEHMPDFAKYLARLINNHFTKYSDMTIVPTKKIYDKMIRLEHAGRFTIIPSGIDLKPFYKENHKTEDVESLKASLGIKPDEFVAIVVARIAKEKSLPDLVDAFSKFNKKYPKSKFIMIGDGPFKVNLDKHIEALAAGHSIKTLGFVKHEEVAKYYQIADVFLNASTTETQGLTYVEALAAGLPIIVRYDEVFDSFVENNVNGIFFNKTEELYEILCRVQEDLSILETLKKNAKDSVINYSKEQYALNAENLYKELIAENKIKLELKK
ncbi:alpha-monoglucosyldiacylglycerol synthase [Acholeplasma hippikon]|uniref:GDP-mannose-dependent alpha-mannosyltransferase n=1 Tax=Acholeplasma hippikon TaxID=264636 RepID=A0A449BIH4_9MOLU|nr:glycosyltransferase [Acholeplasma hippikon]VEU82213.1 GDP-mannose-dependent alpha-mannosyltransferase [Acholeplasma hippikon]